MLWVLTGGSFRILSDIVAMAIPLEKVGNPKIEYYNSREVIWSVDWNVESVIYLASDASLITDGRGNTSFIFVMFTIDT
jgi:hypothetical protein